MLWNNTESTVKPNAVNLGVMPDGTRFVRLADNIREEIREDNDEKQTIYVYDEVSFELGVDRTETAEDIEAEFEAWWAFGAEPAEEAPTLEERVAMLEDFIIGGGI